MVKAYTKVWNTIRTAGYIHLTNGSVLNLINNFGNMYNRDKEYRDLLSMYNDKLKITKES
jgi:hypothetical protein